MTAKNPSITTTIPTADSEITDADLAKVTGGGGKAKTTPLLEIDGIKGESNDTKHPGTVEISWPGATGGTKAGSGRGTIQDVHFTKTVDKSSPILL